MIGRNTGTRMVMAAMVSRKHPATSRIRLIRMSTSHGSVVIPSTASAKCSVTRVVVRIQAKIEAAATMNSTTAVVSMVSKLTRTSRRRSRVR